MGISYDIIYKKSKEIIKRHNTREPKQILEDLGVYLIAFKEPTKLLGMYKIVNGKDFVFYNPFVDTRIQTMVFAHELGHHLFHHDLAEDGMLEYQIFDITSEMELEANIFAAHLLLDENSILDDVMQGYTYDQLARIYEVNSNLIILKLNEMNRLGMPVRKQLPSKSTFFREIDGRNSYNY